MVPWTDHSAPGGWVVVPPKETELALTSSMRAVIPVKPVTMRASKLTINPILVMACGCSSSVIIVPLHDSVRTSALAGSKAQINAEVTNSVRDMATHAAQVPPHCWLTNRKNIPTTIARAIRIPTTNEIIGCRLGLSPFDPALFCAAPRPNQKGRLPILGSSQSRLAEGYVLPMADINSAELIKLGSQRRWASNEDRLPGPATSLRQQRSHRRSLKLMARYSQAAGGSNCLWTGMAFPLRRERHSLNPSARATVVATAMIPPPNSINVKPLIFKAQITLATEPIHHRAYPYDG
jgi:hypothetical protein